MAIHTLADHVILKRGDRIASSTYHVTFALFRDDAFKADMLRALRHGKLDVIRGGMMVLGSRGRITADDGNAFVVHDVDGCLLGACEGPRSELGHAAVHVFCWPGETECWGNMAQVIPQLELHVCRLVPRSLVLDVLGCLVVGGRREVCERLGGLVSEVDLFVAQELPSPYLDQERRKAAKRRLQDGRDQRVGEHVVLGVHLYLVLDLDKLPVQLQREHRLGSYAVLAIVGHPDVVASAVAGFPMQSGGQVLQVVVVGFGHGEASHAVLPLFLWVVLPVQGKQVVGVGRRPAHARLVEEAVCGDVVHLAVACQAREAVGEVDPGTQQDGASGQRDALVAHDNQHGQDHAAASRVAGQDDGVGIVAVVQQPQIGGEAVDEPAGEGELRGEAVFGGQQAGVELAGVALHLVAVLVDAAKVVGAAVHIQHDALAPGVGGAEAVLPVLAHLDPLGLEGLAALAPPLPPRMPADRLDALGAQLRAHEVGRALQLRVGDGWMVDVDPVRHGHPLRGEGLQLLDRMQRGIVQEAPDQLEALVVGDVRRRLVLERAALEVVRDVRLDDGGCDGGADGDGVDGHPVTNSTSERRVNREGSIGRDDEKTRPWLRRGGVFPWPPRQFVVGSVCSGTSLVFPHIFAPSQYCQGLRPAITSPSYSSPSVRG